MSHDYAQNFSLANRVVLITGASSGIGAHLARLAARTGACVVLAARRIERLRQGIDDTGEVDAKADQQGVDSLHWVLPFG